MDFSTFRNLRKCLKISQARLADVSGVSLPSIQNIEAGIANPSADTIEKIAKALGLRLVLLPLEADWAILSLCGVPLVLSDIEAEKIRGLKPSRELLFENLPRALLEIAANPETNSRHKDALVALLYALKMHFHASYQKLLLQLPGVDDLVQTVSDKMPGRIIKLQRIATSNLAGYL